MTQSAVGELIVWAGPILRRTTTTRVSWWLGTNQALSMTLALQPVDQAPLAFSASELAPFITQFQLGQSLFITLLDLNLCQLGELKSKSQSHAQLPIETWIGYDLRLAGVQSNQWLSWQDYAPWLGYTKQRHCWAQQGPGFVLHSRIKRLVHGSCRKPHAKADDGFGRLDGLLAASDPVTWPALLILHGDQVYNDDVAGPMLMAAHALIAQLGIENEQFEACDVADSQTLHRDHYIYVRDELLPEDAQSQATGKLFFKGIRKPIFTTVNGANHLLSFAEMLALFLLSHGPRAWQGLNWVAPANLAPEQHQRYNDEQGIIADFKAHLPKAARVLAHLSTAMMFDDHDVTDDWNLSIAWEEVAYGHPLARRVIGNALLAYWFCQGFGNDPDRFEPKHVQAMQTLHGQLGTQQHLDLIDELLGLDCWDYHWPTQPPLIVLDTRTKRWRSERSRHQPSGLMDWEHISELQQQLLDSEAVLLVSPTPVFGVKLIESIQQVFIWFRRALVVDAENWMAHPGAAYGLLNVFRHKRTPKQFVLLSGDVHYSFVYRILHRDRDDGPEIWQLTSSGVKNEFPEQLLRCLDLGNQWLFGRWSPLNWFTKRKEMRVQTAQVRACTDLAGANLHMPKPCKPSERLANRAGIGLVELDRSGRPTRVVQLSLYGDVEFTLDQFDAHDP